MRLTFQSAVSLESRLLLRPISLVAFSHYPSGRFAATGVMVEDQVVQELLHISWGHPYVTLDLAQVTWNLSVTGTSPVTDRLVGRTLGKLPDAEDSRYIWGGTVVSAEIPLGGNYVAA